MLSKHFKHILTPTDGLRLHSVTNHPRGTGSVLHKTALTSDANHTSGFLGHPPIWLIGYKFKGSYSPSSFDSSLEQLAEFRKILYLLLKFHYKGHKSGPSRERYIEQGLEGPQTLSPLPSPCGMRKHHRPGRKVLTKKLLWALVSRVFIGILLQIESLATQLNFISCHQPPHTHQVRRLGCYHMAQSPNTLITWLVFLLISLILSHLRLVITNPEVDPRSSWIAKTIHDNWEILRVLEAPC